MSKVYSGIYKITNILNNKVYIGSSINLTNRKYRHFTLLKHNTHDNSHLQSSYNKYGKCNFRWEIIEFIELNENLIPREQHWMDILNACDPTKGYNKCPIANSRKYCTCSYETVQN